MKTLNRRQFFGLGVLGASGVATKLVGGGLSQKPPPDLPFVGLVSEERTYNPDSGILWLPLNVPNVDYRKVLNAAYACQPNSSMIIPAYGSEPTVNDELAVRAWMVANAPAGAGQPVPQVGFLGAVIVVVAVLTVGGIIIYGLWQLVQQIPPPQTNCPD